MTARPWANWPSWVVELVSGLATVAAIVLLALLVRTCQPITILIGATLVSIIYELALDPNGWSVTDVAEREFGILAGVCALWILCGAF